MIFIYCLYIQDSLRRYLIAHAGRTKYPAAGGFAVPGTDGLEVSQASHYLGYVTISRKCGER